MNYLKLTKDKLSTQLIADLVSLDSGDSISLFISKTEDSINNSESIVTLEYDANEATAVKAMENLCEELRMKWPDVQNIAIYHRLGVIPARESSIIIGISSPYPEDAIKATNWCIENIKKSVPIWKKDINAHSKMQWLEKDKVNFRQLVKTLEVKQSAERPPLSPHSTQIQATSAELNQRISRYIKHSKDRVNINNLREFHRGLENSSFTCARIDATVQRRKDSKSHLQVNRDLSAYQYRDQNNSDYLTKLAPPNGIEERLQSIECQLSLTTPVPKNIYSRLKAIEERLMLLESVSPEYILFWEKMQAPTSAKTKKLIFSMEKIDDILENESYEMS